MVAGQGISICSLKAMDRQCYGYLRWLGRSRLNRRDVHWIGALGRGGQSIRIVPELDLVVVVSAGYYHYSQRAFQVQYGIFQVEAVPRRSSRTRVVRRKVQRPGTLNALIRRRRALFDTRPKSQLQGEPWVPCRRMPHARVSIVWFRALGCGATLVHALDQETA